MQVLPGHPRADLESTIRGSERHVKQTLSVTTPGLKDRKAFRHKTSNLGSGGLGLLGRPRPGGRKGGKGGEYPGISSTGTGAGSPPPLRSMASAHHRPPPPGAPRPAARALARAGRGACPPPGAPPGAHAGQACRGPRLPSSLGSYADACLVAQVSGFTAGSSNGIWLNSHIFC